MPRSRDLEMDEFDENSRHMFGMDAPEASGGDSYDEEKLELGDSGRKNPFARLTDEDLYGSN
jgi:hypothetical protein